MAVIIKALSIMLNIYTFLTILSVGCVILLILKIKAIAPKLDISLKQELAVTQRFMPMGNGRRKYVLLIITQNVVTKMA